MPLALIRLPRRRSIVSSMPNTTGPVGAKASSSRPNSRREAARGLQATRLSTRWEVVKRRSRPSPAIRNRLVTVRLPGARMAPISSSSAWRHVRCCENTGAKARMRAAKRSGRRGTAASLGGNAPALASHSPRHLQALPTREAAAKPAPKRPKSSKDDVDEKLMKLLSGHRNNAKLPQAINVMTFFDKMDKKISGIKSKLPIHERQA